MSILPEVDVPAAEISLEDIQVGDPGEPLLSDQTKFRQLIWANLHIIIGKGNDLPPMDRGSVCDIDVGDAHPVAQRVRPVAPKFRENLDDLIKGLLTAQMICPSNSPWPSPIVVINKKNGGDI